MRIRLEPDKKPLTGTPTEIAQKMRESSFYEYDSLDAYIEDWYRKVMVPAPLAKNEEERCLFFLQDMVELGLARLELDVPQHVDKFAIALLKNALGLSQENLARKIGVSYTTV